MSNDPVESTHPAATSRLKRLIDISGATVGLVVFSPVMAVCAGAIVTTMGRPILFRQERPGLDEELFTMLKFRTMRQPREDEVWYNSDKDRLTRLGRLMRKTSLDELPQFWNVLRGDMSLVGPRPLLEEYLSVFSARHRRRHQVRPGITGWAQINGLRGDTSIQERIEADIFYIENWSFWLDLKIIILTPFKGMINANAY